MIARAAAAVALLVVIALPACKEPDVFAQVGSTKIRKADLDLYLASRPASAVEREKALNELVERALLAEGARKHDLLADPAVRARVDGAEREVLAQALLDKEVGPSRDDVALRALYKERASSLGRRRVHVAQIFIQLPPPTDQHGRLEAHNHALLLAQRATKGEPFDELARKNSEDKISAAKGGDLGPLLEGQVDAKFFEAAAQLKVGEISAPVQTGFGFHVLKALETPSMATPTFEEARGRLAVESASERESKLLSQLRASIRLRVEPDAVAAAYAAHK